MFSVTVLGPTKYPLLACVFLTPGCYVLCCHWWLVLFLSVKPPIPEPLSDTLAVPSLSRSKGMWNCQGERHCSNIVLSSPPKHPPAKEPFSCFQLMRWLRSALMLLQKLQKLIFDKSMLKKTPSFESSQSTPMQRTAEPH